MPALALALGIADLLSGIRVTPEAVAQAKTEVRHQRIKLGKSIDAKGPEYVVERLFRPIITDYSAKALQIPETEVDRRIYSSHYHTTPDDFGIYARKWAAFRAKYPDVDTYNADGQNCRADLFIALPNKTLVSCEFKYVSPNRTIAVEPCVSQVLQHLSAHGACVLVMYAARPTSLVHIIRIIQRKRFTSVLALEVGFPTLVQT